MSYTYPQYTTGFELAMPTPEAQRLNELIGLHGVDVVIVRRTRNGTNPYGNPTYSEESYQTRCMRNPAKAERNTQRGNVDASHETIILPQWTALEETDEVEINGVRYHIATLLRGDTFLAAQLEVKQ